MLELMRKTAFFAGISDKSMKEISAFSELITFNTGAQAIVEGDTRHHLDLLLLVDGEVEVESKFSPLPSAMAFNLHAISSELFGEIAWILGGKRSASVKCKKKSKFIKIDGGQLFDYCQSHPTAGVELMTRIAAVMAQRVIHLSEQLKNKDLFL